MRSSREAPGIRGDQPTHVLADHIGLDLHPIASFEVTEGGMSQRVFNDRELEGIATQDLVDRETYAIDGDRAMRHQQLGDIVGDFHVNEPGIVATGRAANAADAIDVALDDMPTKAV